MKQLWAEIDQIIEEGTPHRRGYSLKESTFPATVEHMKEEVIELETSINHDERVNELGDVLAIVFHAAKQLGLTMEQLEAHALAKLKMRFPGHEPKPAPQPPSTVVVFTRDPDECERWIIPRNPHGVMAMNVIHFGLVVEAAGLDKVPHATVMKVTFEKLPHVPRAMLAGQPQLAEALEILTEAGVKLE